MCGRQGLSRERRAFLASSSDQLITDGPRQEPQQRNSEFQGNCRHFSLGWHVCRMKLARNMFFEARIFSRKMLRNFPRNVWAFILCVRKNPANFPHQKNPPTSLAGAQGELFCNLHRAVMTRIVKNSRNTKVPPLFWWRSSLCLKRSQDNVSLGNVNRQPPAKGIYGLSLSKELHRTSPLSLLSFGGWNCLESAHQKRGMLERGYFVFPLWHCHPDTFCL